MYALEEPITTSAESIQDEALGSAVKVHLPLNKIGDRPFGDIRPLNDKHVKELLESIKDKGLIQPVVIDENNCLLAGAHRKAALERLYRKDLKSFLRIFPCGIPCHQLPFNAIDDPLHALEIELSENEKRRNYTRAEILAVANKLKEQGYSLAKGRGNKQPLHPALQVAFGVSRNTVIRALKEEESNVPRGTFDSDEPPTFNPSDGVDPPASSENTDPTPAIPEPPPAKKPKAKKKKEKQMQPAAAPDPEPIQSVDPKPSPEPQEKEAEKGISLGAIPPKSIPSGHLRTFNRTQLANIRSRWLPALQMLSSSEAELRKEHERLKNAYNHVERGKTIWTSDFRDVVAVWDEHRVFQELAQAIGCRDASFSEILERMEFLGESVMTFARGMRIFTGMEKDGK